MMIHTVNIFSPCTKEILMKLSELSSAVAEVSAQLTKVRGEILDKIAALEDALIDVDLPEDATAALFTLRANAKTLDDIVPDIFMTPARRGFLRLCCIQKIAHDCYPASHSVGFDDH